MKGLFWRYDGQAAYVTRAGVLLGAPALFCTLWLPHGLYGEKKRASFYSRAGFLSDCSHVARPSLFVARVRRVTSVLDYPAVSSLIPPPEKKPPGFLSLG